MDFQRNMLASLQGGLNFGQQVKQVQDTNQLNQLAGQAYSISDPGQQQSLLGQMASISPAAAQQQQKAFASDEERRNTTMVNMAKMLTSAPEQARAGLYQQMVPTLAKFGLSELPQQYDAQTAPIINQAAQSLVQAYSGSSGASGVQSTYVDADGNRVAIMRDGSTQILGKNDLGATGQTLTIDVNGVPTHVTFDRRTMRYSTASLGGQPQMTETDAQTASGQGGDHFAAFTQLSTEFPGATMTSGVRSAERNAAVGGQPNSQHLAGTAADYVVPANRKPAFMSRVRQLGYQAIDEGDHIHVQRPRGGGQQGVGAPLTGRRKEDEAAAVEAAKLNVQNSNFPNQLNQERQLQDVRVQGAIDQAAGQDQYKRQADAASGLPRVKMAAGQMLDVINKLRNHPGLRSATGLGSINPLNSVPGSDGYNFRVLADQLGGQTFLQAFESLKGGGPITDIEGKKATDAIGRMNLGQSTEEYLRALDDLAEVATAVQQRAEEQAMRQPARTPQRQPQAATQAASDFSNLWN